MPNLSNLSYSQGSPQMYGLPIEDIKAVSLELTNRYNQNKQFSNQVLQQTKAIDHIKSNKKDVGIVGDAVDMVQGEITDMLTNQDFHRAGDKISDMTNDLMGNAGLKQVTANASQQRANFKQIDDAKGYSNDIKNALKAKQMDEYTGVNYNKEDNTATGKYDVYDIEDAPDLTELNSIMALFKSDKRVIQQGFQNVNMSGIKIPGHEGLGDFVQGIKQTKEYITEHDVQRAVLQYLSSSPKYKSYYNTIADAESYKFTKSLGMTPNEVNSSDKGSMAVYNAIREKYKQYGAVRVLSETGLSNDAIKLLAKDPKRLNDTFEAALDKMTTANLDDYSRNGYRNIDIIKEEIKNNEKQKVASMYGNIVGFEKFDSDMTLHANAMFGKLYEENSKIQPFVTPGGNIDTESLKSMREQVVNDATTTRDLTTKLKNLNNKVDPTLEALKIELGKTSDPDTKKQIQSDIAFKEAAIKKEKEDINYRLGVIDMKRQTYEATVADAVKQHPELEITKGDIATNYLLDEVKAIGTNNQFSESLKLIVAKQTIANIVIAAYKQPYSVIERQVTENFKTSKIGNKALYKNEEDYNNVLQEHLAYAAKTYNGIHQAQANKIAKYIDNGGTISSPGTVVGIKGNPTYDGIMANYSTALDSYPDWPIINGSSEPSTASKDFADELKKLKVATKSINFYSNNNKDATGNLMLQVIYSDANGTPVKTIVVAPPVSSVINREMVADLTTKIPQSEVYGIGKPYDQTGQQVTNVLKSSQAAAFSILEGSSNKPSGKSLGAALSELGRLEGAFEKDLLIGAEKGGNGNTVNTYLHIKHDDEGYKFYQKGGINNEFTQIRYKNVDIFTTPSAVLPAIYNLANNIK